MTTSRSFDVVIAGAGLVGLALALALTRARLSVALVERAHMAAPEPAQDEWDSRVYAISPGSAAFLHRLAAWQCLPEERITAVESMHIRGDRGAMLTFSAYDLGERALAWIVEESVLRAALLARVYAEGIEVRAGAACRHLEWSPEHGTLTLDDGTVLVGRLVVAADGIRSWVREAAGIVAAPTSYGQTGVVANFECERPHHGDARQWFRSDGGVLAWLPLPGRRMSMVWSAPQVQAEHLIGLSASDLAAEVSIAGDRLWGDVSVITAARGFPLSFLRLRSPIAQRLALVGDAAHGVHPLAGQGVNLGFGDAEALGDVLAQRGPVEDPGAALLLARYARRRAEPVLAMQGVTDGLARLFAQRSPWIGAVRNAGLSALERLPAVKRLLAQPALR